MIVDMIGSFLLSQVGQTLTRDMVNGLVLLINAAVEHHVDAARTAPALTQPPQR